MAPRGRVCAPTPVRIGEGPCLASTRPPHRHGYRWGVPPVRAMAALLGLRYAEPRMSVSLPASTGRPGGPRPGEALQFLHIVEEQADRMGGLIRDLLDAGRIGAGMLAVDPVPAELANLVERARSAFTGGGARHGIVIDRRRACPG